MCDNLFNQDGTLTRIYYAKPSGNRGMTLIIHTGDNARKGKSLTLVDRDFPTVYAQAVDLVIADRNITDAAIKAKMHSSMIAFLQRYELTLEPVTYLQIKQKG